MILKEIISKDVPLRFAETVGSKTRKYDGNDHDFKADLSRTHGVVKKKSDDTKIFYFLTKTGLVAGRWDPYLHQGVVYYK